jgi:hypothetical protein
MSDWKVCDIVQGRFDKKNNERLLLFTITPATCKAERSDNSSVGKLVEKETNDKKRSTIVL